MSVCDCSLRVRVCAGSPGRAYLQSLHCRASERQHSMETLCYCQAYYPLPARRNLRTNMKRITARKSTAVQRIEMNRFWNEMEEIFDRLEDREEMEGKTREEAENLLNESLECDREVESAFQSSCSLNCWCEKDDNVSGYSSDLEEEEEEEDEDCCSPDVKNDSLLASPTYISYSDLPLPSPPTINQTMHLLQTFHLGI